MRIQFGQLVFSFHLPMSHKAYFWFWKTSLKLVRSTFFKSDWLLYLSCSPYKAVPFRTRIYIGNSGMKMLWKQLVFSSIKRLRPDDNWDRRGLIIANLTGKLTVNWRTRTLIGSNRLSLFSFFRLNFLAHGTEKTIANCLFVDMSTFWLVRLTCVSGFAKCSIGSDLDLVEK